MKDRRAETHLLVWKRKSPHTIEELSQIPLPIGWIRESVSSWSTIDGRNARAYIDTTLERFDIVFQDGDSQKVVECTRSEDATSLGMELVRGMVRINIDHNLPAMKRVIGESDREWLRKMSRR
jgi:hypothetical protein